MPPRTATAQRNGGQAGWQPDRRKVLAQVNRLAVCANKISNSLQQLGASGDRFTAQSHVEEELQEDFEQLKCSTSDMKKDLDQLRSHAVQGTLAKKCLVEEAARLAQRLESLQTQEKHFNRIVGSQVHNKGVHKKLDPSSRAQSVVTEWKDPGVKRIDEKDVILALAGENQRLRLQNEYLEEELRSWKDHMDPLYQALDAAIAYMEEEPSQLATIPECSPSFEDVSESEHTVKSAIP
ncbi:MAG: hypothetical protein Q9162_002616 [Coniocarpon cinnabarinum]